MSILNFPFARTAAGKALRELVAKDPRFRAFCTGFESEPKHPLELDFGPTKPQEARNKT